MDTFTAALTMAAMLSLLIGAIEVRAVSKVATLFNCLSGAFAIYLLILIIGNSLSTMFIASTLDVLLAQNPAAASPTPPPAQPPPATADARTSDPSSSPVPAVNKGTAAQVLGHLPWFWYAALGVFGFEVLLQNINVTFLGRGLLSISDWIAKARDIAVEAALSNQVAEQNKSAQEIASRLTGLDVKALNSYVTQFLGPGRAAELDTVATANGADPILTKALALAFGATEKAGAIPVAGLSASVPALLSPSVAVPSTASPAPAVSTPAAPAAVTAPTPATRPAQDTEIPSTDDKTV